MSLLCGVFLIPSVAVGDNMAGYHMIDFKGRTFIIGVNSGKYLRKDLRGGNVDYTEALTYMDKSTDSYACDVFGLPGFLDNGDIRTAISYKAVKDNDGVVVLKPKPDYYNSELKHNFIANGLTVYADTKTVLMDR